MRSYSYDLPSDVFGPGETKPIRPKKRNPKNAELGGIKRTYDISGVEVCVSIPYLNGANCAN